MRYFNLILLAFFYYVGTCQNVTIRGKADKTHAGKEITLFTYNDLLTYTKTKETTDTIDKDGFFEVAFYTNKTQPVILCIDNLIGRLYVQPDYVYGTTFPAKDSTLDKRGDVEIPVDIGIIGNDSTELNALIIDFNKQFDLFWLQNYKAFVTRRIHNKLDSFQLASVQRYKNISNSYFKAYITYTFAGFNASTSRNKNYLLNNYIQNKPIYYSHYEYMTFFNDFFEGYFNSLLFRRNSTTIYGLINTSANYKELDAYISQDKALSNDTLREFVILKHLIDYYYNPEFGQQQIQSLLEQVYQTTPIAEHKVIAHNMLQRIYQLQPGATAPNFTALDKNEKLINLSSYKGKYVYLNFFSTTNVSSLRELHKLADLKKKFQDKITFISVCIDDSVKAYKEFIKANPKYDWLILCDNSKMSNNAKSAYAIKGLPAFFFINKEGQLAQSPALAPSEGIEYRFNALFRPKRKNTIPGIK